MIRKERAINKNIMQEYPVRSGVFIMAVSALLTSAAVPALADNYHHYDAALGSAATERSYGAVYAGAPGVVAGATDRQAGGDITAGASAFIDRMAGRALGFLANNSLSPDQKRQEFSRLLQESFDMSTIGRFTLGRYWRASSVQQREEYLRLFSRMVVDVYSSRFNDYQGQTLAVRGARRDGESDVIVTSFIIPKQGSEVQIDWRVRYKNGRYQVVDVIVEGVSMSLTQRSDFAAVIQRGGGDVQVLLTHMRSNTR